MAYAIIRTGGKQYKVAEGDIIDIEKIDGDVDSALTFEDVLLLSSGENASFGEKASGSKVTGKILAQRKDKKVIAYKFRRRKGYHRTVGHRRLLTRVKIESIA